MPKIKIIIDNNANIEVTPEGFKGVKCKEITAALEKALGQTIEDNDTNEMYEQLEHEHEHE